MGGPNSRDPFESDGFGDFDYDAFEEEVDEEEPTGPVTEPPFAVDTGPDATRRTFDRRLVPKGDASFTARDLGPYKVVSIRGRMNESFPAEDIERELRGTCVIDLRDVDRVSSFGVRGWLQMLQRSKADAIYLSHCSDAIVNQITMMRNFCGDARIHSFLAPYACDACGADFGVKYHAVADRERIETRRPVDVVCPECGETTEMDEDPFTYFDLVEHLIEESPPELERAIEALDGKKTNPIEIELDGRRTAVRFHEAVTGATRLNRVFNAVEGALCVDLRSTPDVDDAGAEKLAGALRMLDPAITDVIIEGSPDTLTRRLVEQPIDRVEIRSILTPMVDQLGGITRPAVVDLTQNAGDLSAGRAISLPVSWAKGQLLPEDPNLMNGALGQLTTKTVTAAAPPERVGQAPAPTPPPAPETDAPAVAATRSIVPVLVLVGVLAGVLTVAVVALGLSMSGSTEETVEPPPEPVVAADPITAPAGAGWSTGGSLPPAWSEVPVTEAEGKLLIVGKGSGATPAEAGEEARKAAAMEVAKRVEEALLKTPAAVGLVPIENGDPEALVESFASLGLIRQDQAVKGGDTTEVVARYAVEKSKVDELIATLSKRSSFRGIEVVANPPWVEPGLRLTQVPTWYTSVSVGDHVIRVGNAPVVDAAGFERQTRTAWSRIRTGGELQIVATHEGKEVTMAVRKTASARPTTQPEPSSAPQVPVGELLPIE